MRASLLLNLAFAAALTAVSLVGGLVWLVLTLPLFLTGLNTVLRVATTLVLLPHLVERLGVAHPKVRFQGCRAARHDDHIHVTIAG